MINEYSSCTMTEKNVVNVKYQVSSGILSWVVITLESEIRRSIQTNKPLWLMDDKEMFSLSNMTGGAVGIGTLMALQTMMRGNTLIQVKSISTRTIKYEVDTGLVLSGIFNWLYVKIGTIFMRLTFQTPPNIQKGTKFTIHFYKGKKLYYKELILHSTRRKTIQEYREHILDSYDWITIR